ncbi:hypothetical protein HGM15179_017826 [Zosterops borbonicus]|uniref:Uncharacterized protein n=1 Tax=Zosterops borbonicus TaxID=364589 RepID=A0A8K1G059_9PASS|nr:hypothetical protein HGM15179_017826 [Zosterops borbonicus]
MTVDHCRAPGGFGIVTAGASRCCTLRYSTHEPGQELTLLSVGILMDININIISRAVQ